MTKRMLGLTSLRKIRTRDCYYVDKTDHAHRLVERGKCYFLSRPRRFDKTLLVDTLQELFEGSEELFRGLAVHGGWDWSIRHPVVRISFGGGNFDSPDLVRSNVEDQLEETERLAGLEPGPAGAAVRFRRLRCTTAPGSGRSCWWTNKPVRARRPGTGAGQPRLPARLLRDDQGLRQAAPFRFPDGGEQILEGGPVLGPEQPASRWSRNSRTSAAARTRSWTRPSPRNSRAWTGTRSDAGTTATTGAGRRGSTIRSACCCCFGGASSARTGSRAARRPSWSRRWRTATCPLPAWTA